MAQTGGEAVAARFSALKPAKTAKGAGAQFRALERTARGRGFLSEAGVSATKRTQRGWLSGEASPSAANRRAINRAYADWGRANISKRAGRTIEVYPDPEVARRSRGHVGPQTVTASGRDIDELARAWQEGDTAAMNRTWQRIVRDQIQDSPPGRAYYTVSHVWFGG